MVGCGVFLDGDLALTPKGFPSLYPPATVMTNALNPGIKKYPHWYGGTDVRARVRG